MTRLLTLSAFLGGALAACGGAMLPSNGDPVLDTRDSEDAEFPDPVSPLRVDVYPTLDLAGPTLDDGFRTLPKSSPRLQIDGYSDVEVATIELDTPIRFTGRVEGFRVNPQVAVLPGEIEWVPSTIRLALPGTVQDYIASTDEYGEFAAWVGPQAVYNLIVQPRDASFPAIQDSLPLTDAARDVNLNLPLGLPVFGRVTTSSGGIAGARVHLVDPFGDRTASAVTDEDGWYTVRTLPGTYDVVCDGGSLLTRPTITHREVVVDPELGAFVEFDYVDLDPALVGGRVVSEVPVELTAAEVRLTADVLIGYDDVDAEWTFTDRLAQGGVYLAQAPPGSYTIEVLPPQSESDALGDPFDRAATPGVSPAELRDVPVVGQTDVPDIVLPETTFVLGRVVDEERLGVEATRIDCVEVGFGQRQWSILSDVDGRFELQLPQVSLRCRATPTADSGLAGISFTFVPGAGEGPEVVLPEGIAVRGRVRSPDGTPELFATVNVRREGDGVVLATGLTDEDGFYEIRVVP